MELHFIRGGRIIKCLDGWNKRACHHSL